MSKWTSSIPILADPTTYPQHVKDNPLGIAAPSVTRYGVPIPEKGGRPKHVAHEADLMDPEGNPLPIVPLYADRMRAGKILGPNGEVFHGQGGSGFGAMPEFYGDHAWANLPNKNDFYNDRSVGKGTGALKAISAKHPHGFVGAVYLGTHDSTVGNSQFLPYLLAHLKHYAARGPKEEAAMMDHIRGMSRRVVRKEGYKDVNGKPQERTVHVGDEKYSDLDDFARKIGSLATSDRQSFLKGLVGALGQGKAKQSFYRDLNLSGQDPSRPGVLEQFNDYEHIPKNHIVSLVRIPHNADVVHRTDGHQVYPWHIQGHYIGDLQHAIPLTSVGYNVKSGARPTITPKSGAEMIQGGTGKNLELGTFGMHNPHLLGVDPEGIHSGNAIQRALVIIPEGSEFDISKAMGYTNGNDSGEDGKMTEQERRKLIVEDYARERAEHEGKRSPSPHEAEQDNLELMAQAESPSVQAKCRQVIARSLPK